MLWFFKIGLCLFSSMSPPDPGLETSSRDVTEKWVRGVQKWPCVVLGVLPYQVAPGEQEALTGMGAAWLLPSPHKVLTHPDRTR